MARNSCNKCAIYEQNLTSKNIKQNKIFICDTNLMCLYLMPEEEKNVDNRSIRHVHFAGAFFFLTHSASKHTRGKNGICFHVRVLMVRIQL